MIQILKKIYNSLLFKYFQLRKNMNDKSKELDKYANKNKTSKIKTSEAKSFKYQKRKRKR